MKGTPLVALLFGVGLVLGCSDSTPLQPSSSTNLAKPPTINDGEPPLSEQVVFSGIADIDSDFPNGSSVGFWIWCEAESENPYEGECNGAMYFYALGITRHVEGEVTEPSDGVYRMEVSSTRDDAIDTCVLIGSETDHGPHNVVEVSCADPLGNARSENAVVNVTGKPES